MKKLKMPTKAETLVILKNKQKKLNIIVPEIYYFTKKDYKQNKNKILQKIKKTFKNKKIILRSSSTLEDQENLTNAGKYKSYQNISPGSESVDEKINLIISDFENDRDQIIAQEFISSPDISGVIFTRNINNNSPYYFLNIDKSGRTDLITSGKSNPSMKTLVFFRNIKKYKIDNKYKKLLISIQKIENLFFNDRLDIEFCIKKSKIFIFQCRPLKRLDEINDTDIESALVSMTMKIEKLKKNNPFVIGQTTSFSNMADWNPAEMIGNRPTNLSMSLYSELITDLIWAKQRKNYGYNDLTSNPLMLNLGGSPFIDMRIDFNSFIPKKLDKKIQLKAMNHYLHKIKNHQNLHDKIEFEIIETCYDFDTKKKLGEFLSKKESSIYAESLKELTNDILTQNKGSYKKELIKIEKLNKEIVAIRKSKLSEIQKIHFHIQSCKNLGTLPFSGLARSAFIATKLLRTLVKQDLITHKELENFYGSINSITSKINNQLYKIKNRNDKELFLKDFGHLRPSTYSISSGNYRENFNTYFDIKSKNKQTKNIKFNITTAKKKEINKLFKKHKLKINFITFMNFSRETIKLREYAKFIFTKSIDEIFKNLISLGKEIKIDRKDMEFISIKSILNYYNNVDSAFKLKKSLEIEIRNNKKNSKILNLLEFPDFINDKNNMYFHSHNIQKGNYITTNTANGEIVNFDNIKNFERLKNKIVLLQSADPGYDFIFSKNIKGLITEYGGANSHMSIRCMELGIPAIIGIGSKEFNFLKKAKNIEINSFQKYYRVLN